VYIQAQNCKQNIFLTSNRDHNSSACISGVWVHPMYW